MLVAGRLGALGGFELGVDLRGFGELGEWI
jgi:hypothetical protein